MSRPDDSVVDAAHNLWQKLQQVGIADVKADKLTRALYSTDAGNYRVIPEVVVAPQNQEELIQTIQIALENRVPITPRGAGTSCAGNAIGPGLVIDYAKHLNRIVEIDPQARTAIVEPGVIQGQLQKAAAAYGLRFGPDPSTSNRCTIGGMIGNNACGPHATAWGRTADNITRLWAIDGQGRQFAASAGQQALVDIAGLEQLITTNLAPIRQHFGRFTRQVSGYSLEHLLPEAGCNLAAMLVGSEGTLAALTQAQVRLVPVPKAPVLVALGYPSMVAAADDVPNILGHKPLAVEGMDARLVEVVRRHRGPGAVPPLPGGQGWLLVEVGGEHLPTVEDTLAAAQLLARDAATDAVAVYPPGSQAAALWRIRADGAGLGGRTPQRPDGGGGQQGWPGFEDAAVPPQHLGEYLRDFEALMETHHIDGLIYGHFGDGCVHVRLDLPLNSASEVAKSQQFLQAGAELVARYGGSISGEHGDGRSRSELLRFMYPPQILSLFEAVKNIFDPENLLNPGVLVKPDPLAVNLRRPQAREILALRGRRAGFNFASDNGSFTTAVHRCTGVAKCHADNRSSGGFMCPSYLATGRDEDSTRGRARILQELANGSFISGYNAPEVERALDLCLACKACSTDCPAGVDMSRYRSEVFYRRYRGRLRPLTHYLLGWLPRWLRLAQAVPGIPHLANAIMSVGPIRRLAFSAVGIDPRREMPPIATHKLSAWAATYPADELLSQLSRQDTLGRPGTRGKKPEKWVCLWADEFSQGLDARGLKAAADLLEQAGYCVVVANPRHSCGLTWITTGQLVGARRQLRGLVKELAPYALSGIPIVGVEPSTTAVLRDDLPALLPDDVAGQAVAQGVYTLAELLVATEPLGPGQGWQPPDLSGVEVVAQPHCHHYSVMGWAADAELLRRSGAEVIELSGCCGLAGNFGMESGHYEVSVAVAENSLLPALREHPDAVFLADGFSCRTQGVQLAHRRGVHLAELLGGRPD